MASQKVVIPVKTGIHSGCNLVKALDFRFRGNDGTATGLTFCESIKFEWDENKDKENLEKHGVSFELAQ